MPFYALKVYLDAIIIYFYKLGYHRFWNQNRCIWVGDDMDAQKRLLLDLMNTM